MILHNRLSWLAATSAAFLLACACAKDAGKTAPSNGPAAGEIAPDTVVATFNGQKITAQELDEQIADQLEELQKQKHQLRKQAIDAMVIQRLVKATAEKKGMTEEQWLKAEIDDKVPPPSEEELKATFEASASQLPPGSTFEEYKDRIAEFMTRPKKQELAQQVFNDLKAQANVQITLPEPPRPRKQVEAVGPARGPENAPVTIVEFSDFQCPYCSRASATVEEVMKAYPGKVRLVFRHFPLAFHKEAPKAAEASMCAHDQGKFWEYHDTLFKNQQKLQVSDLKEYATSVGLDAAKFNECLDSGKHASLVTQDMEAAKKVGVSGTPAFFINGIALSGAQPLEEFKQIIDAELKGK